MTSPFVQEQLAALVEVFGAASTGPSFAVSTVSQQFRDLSATDIRPNHALSAARNTRARQTWSLDRSDAPYRITIGLTDITTTAKLHTMVTVLSAPPQNDPIVGSAWRVPRTPDGISPTEALLDLIEQAGLTVRFAGRSGRFIPDATSDGDQPKIEADRPEGHAFGISVEARKVIRGWQASWIYAIDATKQATLLA